MPGPFAKFQEERDEQTRKEVIRKMKLAVDMIREKKPLSEIQAATDFTEEMINEMKELEMNLPNIKKVLQEQRKKELEESADAKEAVYLDRLETIKRMHEKNISDEVILDVFQITESELNEFKQKF